MTECKSSAWIGLDVGKKTFSAAIDLPVDGRRRKLTDIPCREFARTPKGVEDFFAWTEKTATGLPAGIVMETTGCYSQHLADWIGKSRPSIPVTIENARALHAFIQSLNLPHKTDRLDAQAIARFGTERRPAPSVRPSPAILALRELSRERSALIKARTELRNRRDSLSTEVARRHNARTLAALTTQIQMLDDEIKACVVEDEELLAEVHVMTTMPGVKFVSAYSILAEIGSLKQYSAKELSAISGLCPRILDSGTSVHSSYMSRRSSARLRQILYLDSVIATRKIPVLSEFYSRLVSKGKKKMTARCACMRKMLLMLRAMVVAATPYSENIEKISASA
jgi:transposase